MTNNKNNNADKTALLLTGGGARAAYQVGVLKAISKQLPRNSKLPFQIISGTSAGALNGASLACYASCFHLGVRKLEWVWRNFHADQVYYSDYPRVFRQLLRVGFSAFQADYANKSAVSLLDNKPLHALLSKILDLKRIDRNIQGGYLSSLSVTASCYDNGDSITFFQSSSAQEWKRSKRSGKRTLLGLQHLMASSALPIVFPSVRINQQYFGDGAVNQLAPLSAPIHLGANRIFIISVADPRQSDIKPHTPHHPSLATIAGHLLDTVFSDSLNSDIERLKRINKTIELLQKNEVEHTLKPIEPFLISPSQNFTQIASEHFLSLPMAVRSILRLTGIHQHSDSSVASYLLFEPRYTRRLIDLGYTDAMNQMDAILHFLSPTPSSK